MHRIVICVALSLLLVPGSLSAETPYSSPKEGPTSKPTSQPAPKTCQTGCAVSKRPQGPLSGGKFGALLEQLQKAGVDRPSKALETLLFYGEETRSLLKRLGSKGLSADKLAFLNKQLSRKHAFVSVRVVDRKGVVRIEAGPRKVLIGHHFHFHSDKVLRIQNPVFSGRVERVGLHHLWTRI